MQTYDVVLKQLLTSSNAFIHRLAQVTVKHWLNVELPQTQNPRIDLLCETTEGIPLHIELQNNNDSLMALRMAEYALQIYRRLERFPQQIVLYTGNAPLTMRSGLQSPPFRPDSPSSTSAISMGKSCSPVPRRQKTFCPS